MIQDFPRGEEHMSGAVSLHHHNEPAEEIAHGDDEQVTTSFEHSERQYYTCPDSSCQKIFAKCFNLEKHLAFGNHSYRTNSNSGMNVAARLYASKCDSIRDSHNLLIQTVTSETVDSQFQQESTDQKRIGWALKHRKKATRFSEKVKDYLFKICEECDRTGKRPDSSSLSEELKRVTDKDGVKLFKKEEWLSSSQIKGYIASYLSKKCKSVIEPPPYKKQMFGDECCEDVCIDEDEKLAEIVSALDSHEYIDSMTGMIDDVFTSVNVE